MMKTTTALILLAIVNLTFLGLQLTSHARADQPATAPVAPIVRARAFELVDDQAECAPRSRFTPPTLTAKCPMAPSAIPRPSSSA